MDDTSKGQLLSKLMEVYPVPQVLNKLLQIIDNPKVELTAIDKIIKHDQYFTLKLLKLANSSYYGSVSITTVRDAVKLLGFDSVKQLSIHTAVMQMMGSDGNDVLLSDLWKHSVAVAVAAKLIAAELYVDDTERFFTAGILHDVGMMIENNFFKEEFKLIIDQALDEEYRIVDIEKAAIGFDHAEISCMIIKNWGLPNELHDWVKYHHSPLDAVDNVRLETSILRLADIISIRNGFSVPYGKLDVVEQEVMNYLEIDIECLTNLITMFNVEINNVLPYFEA